MKNMIKVLSWTFGKYLRHFQMLNVKGCSETALFRKRSDEFLFKQFLGHFHMLFVKASSEMGVFTEWSDEFIHSVKFRKYISYDHHIFTQNV